MDSATHEAALPSRTGFTHALDESYRTVKTDHATGWRRLLAFLGPGFLVAVGYMDPGNWATSIAGGASEGYTLLSVVLASSLMAMLLQALTARLAIATGFDLARACREYYPRPVAMVLWVLAEVAIIATDIAEVVGTAIGLQLLFGIPITIGVLVTAIDVLLILALQRFGFRKLEAFVIALLLVIFISFIIQMLLAQPVWSEVAAGLVPSTRIAAEPALLYLALGIIGATVMPHNLYLHSGIVQTRAYGSSESEKRSALKFAVLDSTIALSFAFLVNAAILILAAATFFKAGAVHIKEIGEAQAMLTTLLGGMLAPQLFAIALLCCGLNSSVTGTLAGQIVMEGFLNIRLPPWARRMITRLIAIVPAILVTLYYGETGTGALLIFSQVVLAFQLPFAIVPLLHFTGSKAKMKTLSTPLIMAVAAWAIAALIIGLNIKLIVDVISS
ncbi:Nramp family divalent metal transporter [Aestuariivirga litoralis]|uniref:Nramp family divalent metal transporter n=1 Tax=Aestuariivirga litoralis TaxID=2650924 RepID=UPI0018C458A9|nr:Nramp family divalent metal transporter [Aestuariivirga litoralis]MBG1231100.1 divalent metal cation transporter [Aestuariivirga litoralis]